MVEPSELSPISPKSWSGWGTKSPCSRAAIRGTRQISVPCVPTALRLDANVRDVIPYYMLMLDRVRELTDEFDILHFHIDQFHFPLFRPIAHGPVTTVHGRQDLHDLKPLSVGFYDMPLISISDAQRRPVPNTRSRLVRRGNSLSPSQAHLPSPWRISGLSWSHLSGETARSRHCDRSGKQGIPLKIAAKVDKVDGAYFSEKSSRCSINPASSSSARSTSAKRPNSWARRGRSCFRSTGRSHSDYPWSKLWHAARRCSRFVAAPCPRSSILASPASTMISTMDEAVKMLPQVLALDRRAVRRRFEENASPPHASPGFTSRPTVRCSSGRRCRSAKPLCRCARRSWRQG